MNTSVQLLLAAGAGTALGLVNFVGLWQTLRWLPHTRRPAPWLFGSLIARLALVLTGLYLVGGGHWERILAALTGILVVRTVMVRRIRLPLSAVKESAHHDDHPR